MQIKGVLATAGAPSVGLSRVDGELVVRRQVKALKRALPASEVVVVVGHEWVAVSGAIGRQATVVENEFYDETHAPFSLAMGMMAAPADGYVIAYGDSLFDRRTVEALTHVSATTLQNCSREARARDVGVNVVDGMATRLGYGLPSKWAQLALLRKKEASLFLDVMSDPAAEKFLGSEALNAVLDRGGELEVVVADPRCGLRRL
jgi:hypothetical protein